MMAHGSYPTVIVLIPQLSRAEEDGAANTNWSSLAIINGGDIPYGSYEKTNDTNGGRHADKDGVARDVINDDYNANSVPHTAGDIRTNVADETANNHDDNEDNGKADNAQ